MTDFKVKVLGCGSSGGVPLITGDWGVCDPEEPKNRRRRPCLLISSETTTVLIDAGPDIRDQLLEAKPEKIDALVITHDHADHTHGLDELRFLVYRQAVRPLPTLMSQETNDSLLVKFPYAFASTSDNALYPALFQDTVIGAQFKVGDLDFKTWQQPHGRVQSLGFRIGDFAYSTDAVDLNESHFQHLEGLDTWLVDTVRYKPHKTHAHLDMSKSWVERLRPKQTYLTHMSHELDYQTLSAELPAYMQPAFDGLIIDGKVS